MSQVPPPQPPLQPQNDNTGAVVAAVGTGTSIVAVIIVAVVAMLFFALCVIGILIALLLPAIQAAREAARRAQSTNNLRQIAISLMNYESVNAHFPPQFTVDKDSGLPLLSWRVWILPQLEQQVLYQQFNQNQPWTSDDNSLAVETPLDIFRSPRYTDIGNMTNYVAIAGEGFVFNGDKTVRMSDIADGMSNTMMLIEIANSDIAWAEPRDLTMGELQLEDAGASRDATNVVRSMAAIGFVDGHVNIMQTSDPEELRKLLTISGGEPVSAW